MSAPDKPAEFALWLFRDTPVREAPHESCARTRRICNTASRWQFFRACAFGYCHSDNNSSAYHSLALLSEPLPIAMISIDCPRCR